MNSSFGGTTKIAVIGGGVIGLSTAINIQNLLPNAKVKVIADKFGHETTSIGAGGIFRPNMKHIQGVPRDVLLRWSKDSWKHFSSLALSPEAKSSGLIVMPGYIFSNEKIEGEVYEEVVFNCQQLTQEQLRKLGMERFKYGYQLTSVVVQMTKYLPWLLQKFLMQGGETERRKLTSFSELYGHYDIVVNCSALGSQQLANDKSVFPSRGQLVKLHAPWMKVWIYTDDDGYVLPNADFVAVGGVRQKDRYNLEIDSKDRAEILRKIYKLWPPLHGSSIVGEWVGLRPYRVPIRLETQIVYCSGKPMKVVHNYGHGGNGVTTSWGTSLEAAKLVLQALNNQKAKL